MAHLCGRVKLGNKTRYHLVGGTGTVRRTLAKEILGTLSRAGWEGGFGKMARVAWREGIGIITREHFVCGFENVGDRVRRMD
jgi:hypothetical protein